LLSIKFDLGAAAWVAKTVSWTQSMISKLALLFIACVLTMAAYGHWNGCGA